MDVAVNEINNYSDKELAYTPIKKGKSVVEIEFSIKTKSIMERIEIRDRIEKDMGSDQMSLFDRINGLDKK